jgi:7-cyano-7-deazaguanine synthase
MDPARDRSTARPGTRNADESRRSPEATGDPGAGGMKTVILLSGGIDSSVLAYDLRDKGDELTGFWVNYGQSHISELAAAAYIASEVCESFESVEIPPIFAPNALTGGGGSVIVPARNLVFLSLAYSFAVRIGADAVAIGVIKDDADRFPDCTPRFIGSFYDTIGCAIGDGRDSKVPLLRTPYIYKSKRDVAELGADLGVPFEKTWSCYGGDAEPCGECLACQERAAVLP